MAPDDSSSSTGPIGAIWSYVVPYFAFLLVVEIFGHLPKHLALLSLILKPAIPAALLCYFWLQREYPELRRRRIRAGVTIVDILVGVASAGLWVVPFVLFPSLRPDASEAFNPQIAGPDLVGVVLTLRFVGFALVTPVFEELFIRSFVMR